jgi:hypothetical protein
MHMTGYRGKLTPEQLKTGMIEVHDNPFRFY